LGSLALSLGINDVMGDVAAEHWPLKNRFRIIGYTRDVADLIVVSLERIARSDTARQPVIQALAAVMHALGNMGCLDPSVVR
jgi:hypothetical protein